MNSYIHLQRNARISGQLTQLPASKSLSNRALILKALSGGQATVSHLSAARDTQLMQALVNSPAAVIDVMDAGTTMRFLTAYFAITNQKKILTGTDRMKQRPIKLLVDALGQIGASIRYLEAEGFPPIEILGFNGQAATHVDMPGNVSSQYISALMMVAPILPKGLNIHLHGETGSVPYITMTAALMKDFGADVSLDFQRQLITVAPRAYQPVSVTIEADWSAASYWFAFTALAEEARFTLPRVSAKSLQGDRVIIDAMNHLGVAAQVTSDGLALSKKDSVSHLDWDFRDCPDLAQTILPVCAVKGVSGEFTGLESLRIKETDRIAALQNELKKIGAELNEPQTGHWHLTPGHLERLTAPIATYHDHRMAMGFAPWATRTNLTIEDPAVVNKSYPGFWEDVENVGIGVAVSNDARHSSKF